VTRIFDALSKARSARPSLVPTESPAPYPIAAVPPPVRPPRPAAERPTVGPPAAGRPAAGDGDGRPRIVRLPGSTDLPPDVEREMTGLRVSLEVALTQRIPRTVMFLASQGGEGTSTVATQFARSLASGERLRVLLVDAHARRPARGPDGSLATSRPERAAARRPAPSDEWGPDLLPLPDDARQEHLLAPGALLAALDAVASSYDWIVIDGPPVLESPDAPTLGAVADGVVVVVQAGRTKRPVLTRSVDLLNRSGGHVLGIVLNRRRLEIPEFIYRRI
jgi:Mrp family chromosome partitioning ATPase